MRKIERKQRKPIQQEMFAKPKNYEKQEVWEIILELFNNTNKKSN